MTDNQWIAAAQRSTTPPPPPPAVQPQELVPPVTGAVAPQASVSAPAPGEGGLKQRMVRPSAHVWLVGAHGGSGESVLASLVDGWAASDHSWPVSDLTSTCPVVLVARTHASGLQAAQLALRQWAGGGVDSSIQLLGLALVADAPGRLPRALRDLASHVAGGAPRTWHISWVEEWRTGEQLPVAELPKAVGKFVSDLTALTGPPGPR